MHCNILRLATGRTVHRLKDMVKVIQECLHVLEDNTVFVPAAVAKMAYAPGDALRRKVCP